MRRPKLRLITDGLSNTVLVGEMAGAPDVIPAQYIGGDRFKDRQNIDRHGLTWAGWMGWVTMWQLEVNNDNAHNLYSFHLHGVNASMCDGSVRFLDAQIDKASLFQLLTRNGGKAELLESRE